MAFHLISNRLRRTGGPVRALVLGATALGAVGMLAGSMPEAFAGPRSYSALAAPASTVSDHRSITLPYAKSTVIDFDHDVSDVFVADPSLVRVMTPTSRRLMLVGTKPGQTNILVYGTGDRELMTADVRVERDVKGLIDLIGEHAPKAIVAIEPVNNNLLLTGTVPNAATGNRVQSLAEMWLDETTAGTAPGEVVNLLSVEGRDQVMLKVRIVEMQRTVTKQLGINLNSVARLGDATVSLFSNNGLATGAGFDADVDWINSGDGDIRSLGGALQALERVGLVRTLAEPSLTAISGETASFLSGGEFPLLTGTFIDEFGNVQRNFTFKPFGVSLGFTPVVLSEGRISLNISTEVSEPTTESSFETGGVSGDILGLRVRRADSVVEMPAGGSLVIAGLIREETRQTSDGIPGIKNVPVLGAAFRNRDDQHSQQELMIIVTPYLVEPTHPDNLQTPMRGFTPANDTETLMLGRLGGIPETGSAAPRFGHSLD